MFNEVKKTEGVKALSLLLIFSTLQKRSAFMVGVFVFISCLFLLPNVASAVMYAPGETLTPGCGPTDGNCGVKTPVYTSDAMSDGALLFTSSSAWSLLPVGIDGQVLKLSGGLPTWGNDAGGTSYTAGSGLSLTGSSFALNLTNANIWSGLQTFSNGFSLSGNTYTDLDGSGLSFAGGVLSASLGTAVESSEITDGTITNADIADSVISFGKIGQNSCATNEIVKWNGSAWSCASDQNTTYTAGAGLSLSSGSFSLHISGLTAESVIDNADSLAIYDVSTGAVRQITRANFLSGITGALVYQGTWDASVNNPSLSDGTGSQGKYYVVSVAGSQNLGSGAIVFTVGDWVVHNGTKWEKLDASNTVDSIFGRTGIITAAAHDYDADQIDNISSGNIAATNVQDAIVELDNEKLSQTLNSGLIFVGNSSSVATGVALSGDATINNSGVLTIGSDAITLGTDTTGNYVATIADSGAGLISVVNSGAENAAVTLGIADDSLNFTQFADGLTLDNSTSLTLAGNDLTFAITGAGLPKFTRTSAGQWMNFNDGTDNFGLYNISGTPESSIAADKGSLAVDTTNGAMYIKTTDTVNTGWSLFASASTGLTSLNGLTDQIQTFAAGTSGTDFAISSSGSNHTFNIPDASATARGVVTTGAQTLAGAKTFSSAITAPTSTETINGLVIKAGALSGVTGITFTSGNLDMANGLITNIGNAGTDFNSNGGLTLASGLTMSGSAANIALGSNYLSGDGGDEGIYVNSSGKVGIGTTSPGSRLHVHGDGSSKTTAIIAGRDGRYYNDWPSV